MKVRRQLEALEPMVLGPLASLPDEQWAQAPDGKWSIGQIVSHLALGVGAVADGFERRADQNGMKRRATPRQALFRHMILSVGRLPKGRKSPGVVEPVSSPTPEMVSAEFRMGVERLDALVTSWPDDRKVSVFVPHPVFGDLNLPEWVRFHYVHCRHHAHQIEVRLRWLAARH